MAQHWSLAWAVHACGPDPAGFVRPTLQGPRTPSPASPRRTSRASRTPPSLGLGSLAGSTTQSALTLRVSNCDRWAGSHTEQGGGIPEPSSWPRSCWDGLSRELCFCTLLILRELKGLCPTLPLLDGSQGVVWRSDAPSGVRPGKMVQLWPCCSFCPPHIISLVL